MLSEYIFKVQNQFFKGHGLGNDYLVFEEGEDFHVDKRAIIEICDRKRGIGSDGIVLLAGRSGPPYQLRMFNPDGSEFERSGNGLRILGSYLMKEGLVAHDPFEISVGGDLITMEIVSNDSKGNYDVKVDMGTARMGNDAVDFDCSVLDEKGRLQVNDYGSFELNLVSMGNPHCVVFLDGWEPDLLNKIAPILCEHKAFKSGTNVQLAHCLGEDTIEALIWERGVGITSASGTSACAVAAAAVNSGRVCPGHILVEMEGGSLQVSVDDEYRVVLRGPVQELYYGRLADGFVSLLE